MPSFQSYLGVDIGSQGVKIVELLHDRDHARLLTYGQEVRGAGKALSDVTKREQQEIVATLRDLLVRTRAKSRKAVGALPTFAVFTTMLTLPKMGKKELPEAIKWEAKKVIPLPIDDMVLDYKVVEAWGGAAQSGVQSAKKKEGGDSAQPVITQEAQETTHIFITAAAKTLVQKYITVFKEAGLELLSLDTEFLALVRALFGHETAPVMIVDIGASTTTIAIVVDQIPAVTRTIEFGGSALSALVQRRMSISSAEAEAVKHLLHDATFSLETLANDLTPLTNELTYVTTMFQRSDIAKRSGGGKIEKVVLTGGGAAFPGLSGFLTTYLSVNTFLGNPWERVAYPDDLDPVLKKLSGSFAIPVGLALREIL